jgi:hypothetical protein
MSVSAFGEAIDRHFVISLWDAMCPLSRNNKSKGL